MIAALPGLLAWLVVDPVTLPDAWMGVSVACGWLGAITYRAVIAGLVSGFAGRELCTGLASSVALEVTSFLTTKANRPSRVAA